MVGTLITWHGYGRYLLVYDDLLARSHLPMLRTFTTCTDY